MHTIVLGITLIAGLSFPQQLIAMSKEDDAIHCCCFYEESDTSSNCSKLCYAPLKCLGGLRNAKNWLMDRLGTPEGITTVAVLYGISQGVSNFLWAFNWVQHAGTSPEAAAIIQEIGGLTASAECFAFGASLPFLLWLYKVRHPSDNTNENNKEENNDEEARHDGCAWPCIKTWCSCPCQKEALEEV